MDAQAIMDESIVASSCRVTTKTWAGLADWERYRDTIKALYLDQKKPLAEVMTLMECKHDFHATVRMYKSRIARWGFDKKNKSSEMEFILRKQQERNRIRKNTSFTVRGRPLDNQAFLNYVKRNHLLDLHIDSQDELRTPDAITYRTPSPSPILGPEELQSDLKDCDVLDMPVEVQQTTQTADNAYAFEETVGSNTQTLNRRTRHYDSRSQNARSHSHTVDLRGFYHWLSIESAPPVGLVPPRDLLIAERLFLLIPTYVAGAFNNQVWRLDDDGRCISTRVTDQRAPRAGTMFTLKIVAAYEALGQKHFVVARQALAEAISLMSSMIRCDYPIAMQKYLAAIKRMTNGGFQEVADIIRKHVSDLSAVVLPSTNPASQIYMLISEVGAADLEEVLEIAWRCRDDSLTRNIGHYTVDVVASKMDHINHVYWHSPIEAETRIRDVLKECEQHRGQHSWPKMNILSQIGLKLFDHIRKPDAEDICHEMLIPAKNSMSFDYQIMSLIVLDEIHYGPGNFFLARQNLHTAKDMLQTERSRHDRRRMRHLCRLEILPREGAVTFTDS